LVAVQLLDFTTRRLLLITGKGGTGKTSVACALGRLGAASGRRTIVVEVDSQHSALTEVFGVPIKHKPTQLDNSLWGANLTFGPALVDWLDQTVKAARMVKLILANQMVQIFLEATPGAREIVVLSRIVSLTQEFDQVIVDMPASGHALGMFKVPATAERLMRTGPIHDRATEIIQALQADSTAIGLVALSEEMVLNETVELYANLDELGLGLSMPFVFLNRCAAPTMTDDEHMLLARLSDAVEKDSSAEDLLRAGRWDAELERATAAGLGRLHGEIGVGVVPFPRLGALGGFTAGPGKVVEQMAAALRRRLAVESRGEVVG
jgi:anion-transporting  ArsA/GET3 family ATPase